MPRFRSALLAVIIAAIPMAIAAVFIERLTIPTMPLGSQDQQNVAYERGDLHRFDWYGVKGKHRAPIVIIIHGGCGIAGSRRDAAVVSTARYLAGRGYRCATIDYELAPKHVSPAQVEDVCRAIWFIRGLTTDAPPVALIGFSVGGTIAAQAAARHPAPIASVTCISSPHDLKRLGAPWAKWLMGDRPDALASRLPPLLLIHGKGDRTIPIEQSRDMARIVAEHGRAVNLIEVPGGHVPTHSVFSSICYPAITEWLARYQKCVSG